MKNLTRLATVIYHRCSELLLVLAAAILVFATRVGYLPSTLGDLDSVNFDLGVHDFNPFSYQPHPPGNAVFIGFAKLVHPWFDTHAAGLAFPSVLFSAAFVLPFYWVARLLVGMPAAALACSVVVFNPVFWLNSVRPMSDISGFTIALTAQCLLVMSLRSATTQSEPERLTWCLGVVVAALGVGTRAQVAVLVGPILVLGFLRHRNLRSPTGALFLAACAAWVVPTIIASGGVRRFLAKQMQVLAEAAPVEPLVSALSWERVSGGAVDAFVSPWGRVWLAGIVLTAAAAGVAVLWRQERRSLGMVVLLFGPYALYHYLLQATNLRYAIPILPLVALPASVAVVRLVGGRRLVVAAVATGFVIVTADITRAPLEAYAGEPSPPAKAVKYLHQIARQESRPVVAGHHVFERYFAELAPNARLIRTLPKEEWRALNRYWVAGGRRPVWFLREPRRRMVRRLVDPTAQTRVAAWKWPDPLTRLLKGARPTEVELVRLDPPRWFAERGFFLTPEAGSPDRVARERHLLFVRPDPTLREVVVSGTAPFAAVVTIVVDDDAQPPQRVDREFSLRVPAPSTRGTGAYVPIRFEASEPLMLTDVALVAVDRDLIQPLAGFHAIEEDEFGLQFRWMAPRARAVVLRSGGRLRIALRGRLPVEYYRLPITLRVKVDGMIAREHRLDGPDFQLHLDLPAATPGSEASIAFSASDSFVPDRVERNGDRRSLAIRVYDLHADLVNWDDSARPKDSGAR